MMPFEWDVRVSSKDHTVTASTSSTTRSATMRYTTMRDSTAEMRRPSVKRRLAEHDWIEITPLDRHEWRISDARIPSSDPAHLLGYIEEQSHRRFEILWMTDPIRWGYTDTFSAALNGFADAQEFVGRIDGST
jgi:hypothetical protein